MKLKKIIIGLITGIISGFFASGGGMILVPAYLYFLGLSEEEARATSVFSILPMVITSSIFYYKDKYIDWKLGLLCAIGGIVGGMIGAKLLKKLSDHILKLSFIVFLLYAAIKLTFF